MMKKLTLQVKRKRKTAIYGGDTNFCASVLQSEIRDCP
jgi:hypothetical protein